MFFVAFWEDLAAENGAGAVKLLQRPRFFDTVSFERFP
jgi:hypothetical protein